MATDKQLKAYDTPTSLKLCYFNSEPDKESKGREHGRKWWVRNNKAKAHFRLIFWPLEREVEENDKARISDKTANISNGYV
jgi:hypothetical protein